MQNFLKNDCGDSAIECGLLVALIGTSVAIAVRLLGGVLNKFKSTTDLSTASLIPEINKEANISQIQKVSRLA